MLLVQSYARLSQTLYEVKHGALPENWCNAQGAGVGRKISGVKQLQPRPFPDDPLGSSATDLMIFSVL